MANKFRITQVHRGVTIDRFEYVTAGGEYWRVIHSLDNVRQAQDMTDCFNGLISREELSRRNLIRHKARKAARKAKS